MKLDRRGGEKKGRRTVCEMVREAMSAALTVGRCPDANGVLCDYVPIVHA